MLSPLVELFYPATEILTEATNQVTEEKTEKQRNLRKMEKDQNTNETTKPVKIKNDININTEWKEYKNIKQNIIKTEINNKVGDTNYYQELQEIDKEVKEERQQSSINNIITGNVQQSYDVNTITMEEMDKVIC